jgi:hypothetical protein
MLRRSVASILSAFLVAFPLHAQSFVGTWTTTNDYGQTVTLQLQDAASGQVVGSLTAPGVAFQVEGYLEEGSLVGAVYNDDAGMYFQADLSGAVLGMLLIESGPDGQPDYNQTIELSFARSDGGDQPAGPAPAPRAEPAPAHVAPAPAPQAAQVPARPVSTELTGDPSLGFFFRTPAGWGAGQRGEAFLLGSDTHHGMILVMPHELGTLDQLRAEAAQGLHDQGVSLSPRGSIEPLGDRGLAVDLEGFADGRPARARAVGLLSPHGGGVTVVALVAAESWGPDYPRWVEEIAGSMEFRAPETGPIARQWEGEVRGRHLRFMESYTSGGGGYNLQRSIYLCSNGEYLYRDSSVISADVPGASASGIGQGGEMGRWEVLARGQDGVLRLTSQEGNVRQYTLSWRNNLVHLNGERYFRDTNDVCP